MKCPLALSVALSTWTLAAATALAQSGLQQPRLVAPTSGDDSYNRQFAEQSPSDLPAKYVPASPGNLTTTSYDDEAAAVTEAPDCGCDEPACGCEEPCCSCNGGCSSGDCGGGWCDDLEGFALDSALGWECCPWNAGGWTQMGYSDGNVPLSFADDDLLSFNDNPDNVNLHQQWLYLERTVDGSGGWDLGGRVDAVYGTDAQKTQSFGNPNAGIRGRGSFDASWDHGIYGFAMPQLYAEVAYHDLAVKVGHFFTPMGYEVVPATGNFFFTHSYTFFNSEPFTHTGALATYTGYENLTLYGGWTLGWDTGFDQLNGGSNFLGGFSTTMNESVTFTYITTYGNFGWRDGGGNDSYDQSIVVLADLSDDLQYVFQSDSLNTSNFPVSEFDTFGIVNYLFYTLNDSAKLGGRIEWWKADGISFNEVTVGVNFNVLENLVVRPEWRQDWAPGIGLDVDTFAVDAILSY